MMEFCVLNLATLIKALNAQMEKAATTATANTGKRRYPNEKRLLVLAVALVLTALLCACKENPMVEEKTVSAKQEILYAYITTQMETNGYGGVIGHKNYICYGVLNGNSIEDKEDRIDFVTIRKSEENHSYIEYYYDRKIYEDGTHYDIYAGAALYLTNDMLKTLKRATEETSEWHNFKRQSAIKSRHTARMNKCRSVKRPHCGV